MQLGDVLRKWRRQGDFSVREAAERIGISFATLSRIEHGDKMDGSTLAKILTWLLSEAA